ncbi:hypothetical protein EFP05_07050 [Lactiplantibacillus pentosus]|nr:hypothetical protein [Lactiplantibacillus pentosus]PRO90948.1 hypothetical protein C6Y13_04145 [Lactiplantibacillus pentosus]GIP68795.1 hypothetical protein AWA1501_09580 [Lactiplantibacillus pentosus]
MINKNFLKDINFWVWMIVLIISIKTTVNIDLSSMDWIIQTIFTIVSIVGIVNILFFKSNAQK